MDKECQLCEYIVIFITYIKEKTIMIMIVIIIMTIIVKMMKITKLT